MHSGSMKLVRMILFYLVVAAVVGCKSKVEAPPKPSLVPAAAVWAGGPDEGGFVFQGEPGTAHRDRAYKYFDLSTHTIFLEGSGTLVSK